MLLAALAVAVLLALWALMIAAMFGFERKRKGRRE